MTVNIDLKTGIHYGVIHHTKVDQRWYDESDALFPNKENVGDEDDVDPIGFYIDKDGYEAYQSNDDGDIFIVKSPFYTICKLCSPCAPNAGDLMSPDPKGYKTYCFSHDWFGHTRGWYIVRNGVAVVGPYLVEKQAKKALTFGTEDTVQYFASYYPYPVYDAKTGFLVPILAKET